MGNPEHERRVNLTGDVSCGDRCLKVSFPSICIDCFTLPVAALRQEVKENVPNGMHKAKNTRSFKLSHSYPMQHKKSYILYKCFTKRQENICSHLCLLQ